jgi:hypothetical protein
MLPVSPATCLQHRLPWLGYGLARCHPHFVHMRPVAQLTRPPVCCMKRLSHRRSPMLPIQKVACCFGIVEEFHIRLPSTRAGPSPVDHFLPETIWRMGPLHYVGELKLIRTCLLADMPLFVNYLRHSGSEQSGEGEEDRYTSFNSTL